MHHHPVLYLGDTSLTGAASYLAAMLARSGWTFDYLPSDEPVEEAMIRAPRRLYIISDYPAAMMSPQAQELLEQQVSQGVGLLMIGGWDSFHGQNGLWAGTPVEHALPVQVSTTDDRVNCDQPALIVHDHEHPITDGLPWVDRPPTIGGFNRVEPKAGSDVVLEAHRFTAHYSDGSVVFEPLTVHPLLVVAAHGQGRTAALTTDLAPHWVGGLVDWGSDRVTAQAPEGETVEVGDCYATFVKQLLTWTGRLDK
jgi:hypothetical protein